MRVLVIEDEPDVVEIVRLTFGLRWPDAEFLSTPSGEEGVTEVQEQRPDIVILDVGLPDIDGFEVLRRVREFSEVPVVILTARHDDVDKVRGLEMGADDYVTKPFSHIELLARVRAVLRRTEAQVTESEGPPFAAGALRIDYASREVTVDGSQVKLTPIEYGLLYHLTRNENRVLTFRTLLAKVWGREYVEESDYLKVQAG
jgi:two-component system KDP operon response regulator KdpE